MKAKKVLLSGIGLLLACMMTIPTLHVYADSIPEPDDMFAEEHIDECELDRRVYRTKEEATVYVSPEDATVAFVLETQTEIGGDWSYKDGNGHQWLLVHYNQKTGWIPKAELEVKYDTISFEEEHRNELVSYSEKLFKDVDVSAIKDYRFWNYPGSEECMEITDDDGFESFDIFSFFYTDQNGLRWGKVDYYRGRVDSWICLDNPNGDYEEISKGTKFAHEEYSPAETTNETGKSEKVKPNVDATFVYALVGAMVGLVVIMTAVILIVLKKKKSHEEP